MSNILVCAMRLFGQGGYGVRLPDSAPVYCSAGIVRSDRRTDYYRCGNSTVGYRTLFDFGREAPVLVISHVHKYLFIETPRTASSAISAELRENYAGEKILHKHANYSDIPRGIRRELGEYVVFAGVRNPLDDAASLFQKLLTNHKGAYSDPTQWVENGGWVNSRLRRLFRLVHSPGGTFLSFLQHAFPQTYCSRICLNKRHCDTFIRFENLQADFTSVLDCIGISQKRKIPQRNVTAGKRTYSEYYDQSPETTLQIAKTFGPFMIEWGYIDHSDPLFELVTRTDLLKYELIKSLMRPYFSIAKSKRAAI